MSLNHTALIRTALIEQQNMHKGVIRDMEQQRIKKERQADFDMQKKMEEEYKKVQKVPNGSEPAVGSAS